MNNNLSPCCNAFRIFIKEQQDLDGSRSNVKYQCTGCGKEYWEYFEDPALRPYHEPDEGLTDLEKTIIHIPVIRYLYLIPLGIYYVGQGILEEAKYRLR